MADGRGQDGRDAHHRRDVRVAVRDIQRASFLKPAGDLGQISLVPASGLDPASIGRAVQGADAVGDTQAEFTAFFNTQMSKWAKLIREAGIQPE